MRQTVKRPTSLIPYTGFGLGDALSVLHPDDAPESTNGPDRFSQVPCRGWFWAAPLYGRIASALGAAVTSRLALPA